ncbi:PadR family transcriptional regulator [Paenibacillus durus]|uniref:PadR family transcriptional regulator n=1 Tax=Paenibacillus durus ATCC 35681 TaxID=1333534 RepID=A0A0F7CGW8_PAEDU|nr:PadR family transcriptional regulator [Paenibacillus durus]AKG33315.1 PadR family transcriptional regulator [Paenibacillus durus ATCC 35681]
MYELFVLGELSISPKHGYEIQFMLKNTVGPIRQISNGTLYPLISRLVENGLINQRDEPQEGGRPRKIYELTEMGRHRFHELMDAPLEYNTDIDLQLHFKMTFFGYVSKEVRLATMGQYLEYLQYNLKYITELAAQVAAKPEIPEQKKPDILRMFGHRRAVMESEIQWALKETEYIATL